jgi:hypothetical protein
MERVRRDHAHAPTAPRRRGLSDFRTCHCASPRRSEPIGDVDIEAFWMSRRARWSMTSSKFCAANDSWTGDDPTITVDAMHLGISAWRDTGRSWQSSWRPLLSSWLSNSHLRHLAALPAVPSQGRSFRRQRPALACFQAYYQERISFALRIQSSTYEMVVA